MPSVRSIVLSFAAVALAMPQDPPSGTVGAGAAGNTYPNCPDPNETCQSFGVDFHNDGVYFQNSDSDADFTFSSMFDGCQKDSNYNVLVDPSGNQYNCTNTNLTPDNTTVTSTCNIEKSSLVSGDWSILLYSNNGQCAPFNAKREFILSVGPQVTSTVTPTVVFTSTTTPVAVVSTTSTSTLQFYAPTPTVTSSKSIKNPTRTVTPIRSTVYVTSTKQVKYITSYDLLVSNKFVTSTAKCTISAAASSADPTVTATAVKRAIDIVGDMTEYLEKRAEHLDHVLVKRAPDSATVYDIITDASEFYTSSVVMTAPTVTIDSTNVITVSATSTPNAVTLYLNPQVVVTLSAKPTLTKTIVSNMGVIYTTVTKYATATVTTTMTPSAAAAKCTSKGGFMQ